jgi:NAD(P)-dependent dehydrogenase (short-subunit alcohol dehydrogenase family)
LMRFKNKVAFVTGCERGIGPAAALAFANEGADVVVTDHAHPGVDKLGKLNEQVEKFKAMGRRSIAILGDVRKWEDVQAMVKRTIDEFGRIDFLANVAGTTGPLETPAWEVKIEDWEYVIDTNLKGTFQCCKAVLPYMIKQRSGCIVNIVGTSGHEGYIWRTPYSSSKWAVRGFTKTLAMEVGGYGIRVNGVTPGPVEGPRMTKIVDYKSREKGVPFKDVYQAYSEEVALERFIKPEEIAAGIIFLCSDESSAVTGQILRVDAGAHLGPFRRDWSSVVLPGAYPRRARS